MSQKAFRVAVAVNKQMAKSVIGTGGYDFLKSFAEVNPMEELPESMTVEFMSEILKDADACLTCWGTPAFTQELLDAAPKLRLVAHSAGTIKHLVPEGFWKSGRRITSNAPVIAEDVAQAVLAYIQFTLRGFWRFAHSTQKGEWSKGEDSMFSTRRMDGLQVGVVSASNVGKSVIRMLQPFKCNINLYDPLISDYDAFELGVRRMELDELISTSDILTVHAQAIENCRHLLNKTNIPLIKNETLFINTSRGTVVEESALIKELESGRFFACLDVTDPEPPAADHPFRTMPNVILTPHITGGHTVNGRLMLGMNSINEIFGYLHRGQLKYEVRQEMLATMA